MVGIYSNYGVGFKSNYGVPSYTSNTKGKQEAILGNYEAKKPSTAKVVAGVITAGVTVAGILYAIKHPDKIKKIFSKITPQKVQPQNITVPEKMSFTDFKKVGQFSKGKALVNGKGFTGILTTKKGTIVAYENGLLTDSIIKGAEGKNIHKIYRKGKILQIRDYGKNLVTDFAKDGRIRWTNEGDVTRIGANGAVTKSKLSFVKNHGKVLQIERDIKTGRIISSQDQGRIGYGMFFPTAELPVPVKL